MKKLLLLLLLIVVSTVLKAQFVKLGFATNVGAGLNSDNGLNFGFDIQADFPITHYLAVTASAGSESFTFFKYDVTDSHTFLPLLGGIKLNIPDNPLYVHAQFGFSPVGNMVNTDNIAVFTAGSVGYKVAKHFDISGKYFGYHMTGSYLDALVLRLSYNF